MQNQDLKFLTEKEVDQLRKGAKATRYPVRNELMVLMLYRHGLRETELCRLRLEQLDCNGARLDVKRIKNGNSFSHPIEGDELRLIRRYLRERDKMASSTLPWLFLSERGNPLARRTVIHTVKACAVAGGLTDKNVTPHMLRHGCGFYLANKGCDVRVIQDYLGHKNIQNTVIYTQLTGKQFQGLWA